ncbi:MAG TPA: hypothetical protein VKA18_00500 [Alphaproteobacteria bacterium]|nr:hypothetical protein [Alphaproteobacteria bacterium]
MHSKPMTWAAMLQLISDDMLAEGQYIAVRSSQAQQLRQLAAELIVDTSRPHGGQAERGGLQ